MTEYDLSFNPESESPIHRLCTLVLYEALIGGVTAGRMHVGADERGTVDHRRGDQWKMVMQVARPAYGPMVARLREMADSEGQIPVRHEQTRPLGAMSSFTLTSERRTSADIS